MESVVKCCKKSVEKVFIFGNHEDWVQQYVDRHPEMEGILDLRVGLGLIENGYKIVPTNKYFDLGRLTVCHGLYITKYHSRDTAIAVGANVLYGHCHQHQTWSVANLRKSFEGIACPCLCRLDMPYLKGKPSNWSHGFAVIESRPGGDFNCYINIITNGRFSYGGKVYGGKG